MSNQWIQDKPDQRRGQDHQRFRQLLEPPEQAQRRQRQHRCGNVNDGTPPEHNHSAADGADFSAEFGCRFITDRRPYPALNLAQGGSLMTAIGNDYTFDEVFARQVAGLGQRGDVLVAITTSGNSRNILRALAEGKARRLTTVALLGRDGGAAKGLAQIELLVRSETTARIQEAHKFLLHVICGMVDARLPKTWNEQEATRSTR